MCEIFAVSSKEKTYANDYLREFYSHSLQHPHGWGLALIDNHTNIIKEPLTANYSHYLKELLHKPIQAHIILAHIRYATIGNVDILNCHPYTLKDKYNVTWTLIHNGTIFDYPQLNKYINIQKGSTDSERILYYIVEKINNHDIKDSYEQFQIIDDIVVDITRGNKLNFILTNGQIVYVHTNYAHSLYYQEKQEQIVFSTQPLNNKQWSPVPFNQLLAYNNGQLLYTGTKHNHEYIDNEKNTKYLYQIFSSL
jgi:glutamine amidotransferase